MGKGMDNLIIKVKNSNRVIIYNNYNKNENVRKLSAEFADGTRISDIELKCMIKEINSILPFSMVRALYSENEANSSVKVLSLCISGGNKTSSARDAIYNTLNSNLTGLLIDNCATLQCDNGIDKLRLNNQDNSSEVFTENYWLDKA